MKHLGDITKINGAEIEPVHCIIGGSPCQDLSIAGKRAGLSGERSGLFVEQVRIVKEMREKYGTAYPRFMVWENVPGAFSSNKGRDFAAVLEEIIKIVEPEAPCVDVPAKGWSTWGGFRDMDGRWSVAWRVHDAQYWGVPQRRRRIALVADFGGDTASEILFDRKSVSGDIAESGASGKRFAETAEAGASYAVCIRGGCDGGGKGALVQTEKSGTLGTGNDQTIFQGVAYGICSYASNSMKSSNPHSGIYEAETARTLDGNGVMCLTFSRQAIGKYKESSVGSTYSARNFKGGTDLVCAVDCRNFREGGEINGTLQAKSSGGQSLNLNNTIRQNMMVRRLTPLECERLQGFPDGWTDIGDYTDSAGKKRKTSDSARYKALGNSIALPFWAWMLRRMCDISGARTMGSLFDGIGGFPLCWERINGDGSCRWASEIEEFPIAVTKRHFKEE